MTFPNWQTVATIACVLVAALVVLRQVIGVFKSSASRGCQSGGCTSCPSKSANASSADFVSLESLVKSTVNVKTPESNR